MRAADALTEWRERAAAELDGAPLASLSPRRVDGLVIPPLAVADPEREEGLASAPSRRSVALVVSARALDFATVLTEGVDVVWLRGDAYVAIPTTHVFEPSGSFDRADLASTVVLADPSTDRVLGEPQRAWHPTDAIGGARAHEAGASAVSEVALVIAAMLDRRRALGTASPPAISTALSPEIFVEMAKLRALRRLADRVLTTLGEPTGVMLYARTGDRGLARLDRATNAIRASVTTAAAMMGGADVVGASAFDGLDARPSALGARLSRNTSLVLALESSLRAVDDPARGSFYVEALTDRIARDAWERVREIERRGGLAKAADWARASLDDERAARREGVRTRRVPMIGVSRFASDEALTTATDDGRDAFELEALRRGEAPPVSLVTLGDKRAVEARASFCRELLEVGAMRVVDATVDDARARVALVAAPDALFATEARDAVAAITARGVDVWVAGRPGAHEAALRDAGAKGFVFVGADVVDALSRMRARAEAT